MSLPFLERVQKYRHSPSRPKVGSIRRRPQTDALLTTWEGHFNTQRAPYETQDVKGNILRKTEQGSSHSWSDSVYPSVIHESCDPSRGTVPLPLSDDVTSYKGPRETSPHYTDSPTSSIPRPRPSHPSCTLNVIRLAPLLVHPYPWTRKPWMSFSDVQKPKSMLSTFLLSPL